jgi:hypothetical protein
MRRVLLTAFLAAAVFPFTARAQSRPDFSGTWTRVADKSDPAPQGRGGSSSHTIKQTATEIGDNRGARRSGNVDLQARRPRKYQPDPEPRRTSHGHRDSEVGRREPRHRNDARNSGDDHHGQGGSHARHDR